MKLPEKNKEVSLEEVKEICEAYGLTELWAKIEKDPNQPEFVLTTWGVGYKFKDESY